MDGTTLPRPSATELPRIHGYEVQEVLGHGGMGIVYKAWHRRLNRTVALKMLLAGAYARPEELERFLREAEAVAAPAPPQHRAGLRRGRRGRPAVLHDGVRRGRQPGGEGRGGAAAGPSRPPRWWRR